MNLLLQRDLRRSIFGAMEYVLNVTLVCDADDLQVIRDHRLGHIKLFALPEIETHRDRADRAFARGDMRSLFQPADAGKLIVDTIAGMFHAARSKFAFAVTVDDAINGTTITCPDQFQLLACEEEITAAFDDLNRHLDDARAFSVGREQVLVPDDVDEPAGPPPAAWADRHTWWRPR